MRNQFFVSFFLLSFLVANLGFAQNVSHIKFKDAFEEFLLEYQLRQMNLAIIISRGMQCKQIPPISSKIKSLVISSFKRPTSKRSSIEICEQIKVGFQEYLKLNEILVDPKLQKKLEAEMESYIESFNSERLERVNSNYGFRGIKPGMLPEEISDEAGCDLSRKFVDCYNLQNIKFSGFYDKVKKRLGESFTSIEKSFSVLEVLILDLGPIVDNGFLNDLVLSNDPESGNVLIQMKSTLDSKYIKEFEWSERDRQMFNEGEKENLLIVYEKGQVALRIAREKKEYSRKMRLFVEYRDVDIGKKFLDENRPKKASSSDF